MDYIKQIEQKLKAVIKLENRHDLFFRLSRFAVVAFTIILFISLAESIFYFSPEAKTVIFFGSLATLAVIVIVIVLLPFLKNLTRHKNPDYINEARKVGEFFPEIKDELSNAIQLYTDNTQFYSRELINAAFSRVYDKTVKLDFTEAVDSSKYTSHYKKYFAILVLCVSIFLISPALNNALFRLIDYGKEYFPRQKYYFDISPGDTTITKGSKIVLSIRVFGDIPQSINLYQKYEDDPEFQLIKINSTEAGLFNYEVFPINKSFEYYAAAEDVASKTFSVNVVNRPIITSLELTLIPPSYSKLPLVTQLDEGTISALPGSTIKIKLRTSRELSWGKILFGDSTTQKLKIDNNSAYSEFKVNKNLLYQFIIADLQGLQNVDPIQYSVNIINDEHPSLEIVSPNKNIKIRDGSNLPIHSKIKDDLGFTKYIFNYRLSNSKYRKVEENYNSINIQIPNGSKEDDIYYLFDLAPLVLAEGEVIEYYLEIFDNDNISGPKSTKSPSFTLEIPSLDELFASSEKEQESIESELKETLKESEKLSRELQKVSDELKQNSNEINWKEKEKIEDAAEKLMKLTEKLENIAQKTDELKKELSANNLVSQETLEKYNELQELLESMNSEEITKAMQRMQDSMKAMMRDQAQMTMEDLKANEEMIKKSIERTINLFKRIQAEQKLDELIKRTEDLSEKISEQLQSTKNSDLKKKQKRDELNEKQKNISEKLDQTEETINDLEEKMSSLKDMPNDLMKKLKEQFKQQKNKPTSSSAEKSIQQEQKQDALQNLESLSENMNTLSQQMKSMRSEMQQMNQMKTFMEMAKALNDLIDLSKTQEIIKNGTDKLSPFSADISKRAKEQSEVQTDLSRIINQLNAISQKTFSITPEMGKAIGQASNSIEQSIKWLVNQSPAGAASEQKNAMRYLNESASLLKSGMEQMMSGGGSGGMMSMMQQLQQMSQQQMQLNQLTQMLNQGGMSQQMQAEMRRLGQQQDMIRKSLEDLNREARESGQSKKLASNLEQILKEMQEVVTNLESQKINDDLIKQQDKILSKLLDAQRSASERDFEEKRKSASGKEFTRNSPSSNLNTTGETQNRLRDELQKAIREGYKKDYQDLIIKYFEALQKEKK